MNPVAPDINSTTTGCGNVISSNCVTFQGNLPDCISYCVGDNLTDVLVSIANVACNALEVGQYNTTNIETISGGGPITDFSTLISQIISSIEIIESQLCEDCEAIGTAAPVEVTLIDCITDPCEGCGFGQTYQIQQALDIQSQVLCDLIDANSLAISQLSFASTEYVDNSIASATSTITTNANNYTDAQIAIEQACYKVTVSPALVTGNTNGEVKCAGLAVEYFASIFDQYRSNVGTITNLNAAYAQQENGLYNLAALNPANAGSTLGDLGVTNLATTAAQSLQNVWITLQDIRYGLIECCQNVTLPCALVAPAGVTISSISTSNATITWDSAPAGIEAPGNYTVEIFAYNGVSATGPTLATSTVTGTSTSINTSSLDPSLQYVVRVTANYTCGTASREVVGPVVVCIITHYPRIDISTGSTNDTCNMVNYIRVDDTIATLTLRTGYAGGAPIINNTSGVDWTFKLYVPVLIPHISSAVFWESYDLVVPNNQNTVTNNTIPDFYYKDDDPTCNEYIRGSSVLLEPGYNLPENALYAENPDGYCYIATPQVYALYE